MQDAQGDDAKDGFVPVRLTLQPKFIPLRMRSLDLHQICFMGYWLQTWGQLQEQCPNSHRINAMAVFKARLDGALSSLVWWKVSLSVAGELERDDL